VVTLTKKKHSGSRIGYITTPHTQQLCNKTTFPDLGRFLIWNSFLKKYRHGEFPKDKIIDCNTPILYFNYALYIDYKTICSAIVNGAAPEDGDV
jgi:hypothetical protein